jgi:hypothetical protein
MQVDVRTDVTDYFQQHLLRSIEHPFSNQEFREVHLGCGTNPKVARNIGARDGPVREFNRIVEVSENREHITGVIKGHPFKPRVWIGSQESASVV